MSQISRFAILVLLFATTVIVGCGGGGGGGVITNATIVGRILSVQTGGPITPPATVQVGTRSTQTAADGSFSLVVPSGSTSLTVDAGTFGGWTFTYPGADGTTDVGDLWVGPQRITLTGRVLDAGDGTQVEGAVVTFAGRRGVTNSVGTFRLEQVAYSNTTQTAFFGIRGTVVAANYFSTEFSAQPNVAISGVVTVNDILLTQTSAITPPPPPFNIFGTVSPAADAPGTVVTLLEAGTPVRIVNVGANGQFAFWVAPGTYTIEAVKGSLNGNATVTLTRPNEVVRQDVTIN